jgi:asparagine synthase (glutamine-hydrolysing)
MGDVDASVLLFYQKIREFTPAVLSGEGADEIFGGHPWFTGEARRNADTFPWSMDLQHRISFLHPDVLKKIDPTEYVRSRYNNAVAQAPTLYDDGPADKRIRQLFFIGTQWYLPTLAARTESMGTAAGLTVCTPFLDHRLVEYLYNVPWAIKHHNGYEKGLLREAFKKAMPDTILQRVKSHFSKTQSPAYLLKVQDLMRGLLNAPDAPLFAVLNRKSLNNESALPWYGQAMQHPQTLAYFLQINAWLTRFSIDIAV